jgi:hypothetical protein
MALRGVGAIAFERDVAPGLFRWPCSATIWVGTILFGATQPGTFLDLTRMLFHDIRELANVKTAPASRKSFQAFGLKVRRPGTDPWALCSIANFGLLAMCHRGGGGMLLEGYIFPLLSR